MSRLPALLAALALVLPFAGCTPYCAVVETRAPRAVNTQDAQRITQTLAHNPSHPAAALGACLDTASAAERRLRSTPDDARARADYNFATGRIFAIIHDAKLEPWKAPVRVKGREGEWLLTFKNSTHTEVETGKVGILPADRYSFHGTYIRTRTLKDGLGAPLVITGKQRDIAHAERFAQSKNAYYGMTGLLRFDGRNCVLTTEDPLAVERVPLGGHSFPLAADFTAPLALALAKEKPLIFGWAQMLRPEKYAHTARIARLQPYDPAKIPVICVHGLMDSPMTWVPFLNTLRGDEAIRQRYQFWFYSYPSGFPYPHSAAIMRGHLDAINRLYPDHKKEILIGHSLGGIMSRTMITDSGMKLWNAYFQQPPEKLAVSDETKKFLSAALIFQHRPEVSRAIFISTPHRGSDSAAGWLGKVGRWIVKVPDFVLRINEETRDLPAGVRIAGLTPNSIERLSPDDPFLRAIDSIPTTRGVPYHSIMGDRGKGGNKDHTKPVSTDSFVPYWSSHLDGAQSEMVVPSKHSAHQNAKAIEEVRRILHEAAR